MARPNGRIYFEVVRIRVQEYVSTAFPKLLPVKNLGEQEKRRYERPSFARDRAEANSTSSVDHP